MARTEAVARSATVGLRFHTDASGIRVASFVDGNRNGVLAIDIASGTDWPLSVPTSLEEMFPGVIIGAPANSTDAPVALGGTEILSFAPGGTSTSGTIHILGRDGSRFAVRLLGATGRVRILRFDPMSGEWVESL